MDAPLLSPAVLAALQVPGTSERWVAVQTVLHPQLAALAERISAAASARFGPRWQPYEISFKSQRYINRGRSQRDPIDAYHVAIDRPPRGAGVYVVVSAADQAILVGLQVQRARKETLRTLWERSRALWEPLLAGLPVARFVAGETERLPDGLWVERYLASRSAGTLFAGVSFPWEPQPPGLAERLVDTALDLLTLNEALMELAEEESPAALRETRSAYAIAAPPIETIVARVRAAGFAAPETLIRTYHVAIQTRPLVILPGISGTGKTRLTRLYADAVYGIPPGAENPHYLIVAVQPDWHNARDLLGYYNALTDRFQPTPFLRFMVRAAADPQLPYFVCLDEMNLARPEYYLAPLLSALETTDHAIDLGTPGETVMATTGETLRNPFRIPLNLRLTGTVNVDESTHALSDKLLDRANVIELLDVDLEAFRAAYRGPVDPGAWALISAAQRIAAAAGQPFGYRTISEILEFVERSRGVLSLTQALDLQLKQKVLPKLRGDDTPRLRAALSELLDLARDPARPLPESAAKLDRMLGRLRSEGFTDFYG